MAALVTRLPVFCLICRNNVVRNLKFSSFKSIDNLKNIYPNSSLDVTKPQLAPIKDDIFTGYIPIKALNISHCRSSGPGGQNVNKVNSKVEVRFELTSASWIPAKVRNKMLETHKSFLNKEGELVMRSEKTASQQLNLADCMDKLRCMVREAAREPSVVPPETKARIRARIERASAERLREKRHQSFLKHFRKPE